MICSKCKSTIEDDCKYCTNCGEKLENIKIRIGTIILAILIFFLYVGYLNYDYLQKELFLIEDKKVFTNYDKEKLFDNAKKDYDLNNFNSAILKYEKLIEINYKSAESNFYLAEIWYSRMKYDIAINYYKKSATLDSEAFYMPILLFHCAISFEKIKDTNNAKNFYLTLIELYPNSNEANLAKENSLIIKTNQKSSTNTEIKTGQNLNKNTFQLIFEYKDWRYESFDNFFRITTNGKVGATGHEFGLIRKKGQCNNNLLWMTFSTIYDIGAYVGEYVKFKIIIDDTIIYQEFQILNSTKVTQTLNIVSFSNFVLNDYIMGLLKKGNKLKVEIVETNKLFNKFDIKFEEFSLSGFVANYIKLDEKCVNSTNKILFEYLENNDYGANGIDRTYKLTKNNKSCIYNYTVGLYNGVITDSCTGEYSFQVRDENGNFVQNSNAHWSPFPYHDAFELMTGNQMTINQKMISTINSKNQLIYCLEDMSICKTEKELKIKDSK